MTAPLAGLPEGMSEVFSYEYIKATFKALAEQSYRSGQGGSESPVLSASRADAAANHFIGEFYERESIHRSELEALRERVRGLEEAGQALVDRWETPLWKDLEHTGKFIHRLRTLLHPEAKEIPDGEG